MSLYLPESALAIMAHPDDVEFACAGTLARWVRAGARACMVLVTSGDVGIAEPGMTRARATEVREAEQRAAAEVLGVRDVVFLRESDGLVQPTLELRKKLVREIRRFRPEVVICGDPTLVWGGETYINHPDHRAVATASIDAIYPAAGQPNLFEELAAEGLSAFKPRKVYVATWQDATTWMSIDETVALKVEALRAHASQLKGWDVDREVRNRAAERAKGHEMDYAESFRVVTLESDEKWEKYRGRVEGRD